MKTFAVALIAWCALIAPALSQGNECDTLESCQAAIKANRRSSLARYRIGEIYFQMGNASPCKVERNVLGGARLAIPGSCENYTTALNEFMSVFGCDLQPPWTVVWAHIYLGKIFDVMNNRDRALNEYRLARLTKDNTGGAQEEVAKFTESPYKRSSN
jgi:tetratricopeptide (TPR) repeat protein